MQGEKKKAESLGGKGDEKNPETGRIDEYNFFLACNEEALKEGIPEGKAKKKTGNEKNKSLAFFLPE